MLFYPETGLDEIFTAYISNAQTSGTTTRTFLIFYGLTFQTVFLSVRLFSISVTGSPWILATLP